jgi:hypothetical protein
MRPEFVDWLVDMGVVTDDYPVEKFLERAREFMMEKTGHPREFFDHLSDEQLCEKAIYHDFTNELVRNK